MVDSDATITESIRKMQAAKVSSLVVKPRCKGDAYGMLTRMDIMVNAFGPGPKRFNFSERQVYELMTKPLAMVSPGLKAKYAIRLMQRERIHRLPVFDGKEIVGILCNSDIFRRLRVH